MLSLDDYLQLWCLTKVMKYYCLITTNDYCLIMTNRLHMIFICY